MAITNASQAAGDRMVLAFGALQGAANRLEHILGRALEAECGITHREYEVLLILGRAGGAGLPMGAISREQVLTTGGVTRLIDRMEAAGLVARTPDPRDGRARLVTLTPKGDETVVRSTQVHRQNIERYFLDPIPEAHRTDFVADLRRLSRAAAAALPPLD